VYGDGYHALVERLVRLFRVTSSGRAVVLLVAFNLLPLAGVLLWGWNVYTLLVLYWVENGIVGVLAIARILRAQGSLPPGVTVRTTGTSSASKVALVPFFLMHYGIFWTVHGVFVLSLPAFLDVPGLGGGVAGSDGPRLEAVAIGAVGLAISHVASFVLNYLGEREYLTTSPAVQMMAPYGRVVILHMTIILGVLASLFLGSPVWAVVILVLLKTVVDLALHLAAHRPPAEPAQVGTPILPWSGS
jgi:hypothetical protein